MALPVRFAPGRLRLATRPNATGSPPVPKTMGMVVVAAFAAKAAGVPLATITATRRRTRSAASAGSRDHQSRLHVGLDLGIDPDNCRDEQRLDEWILQRAIESGHGRFVPISPSETAGQPRWTGLTTKPIQNRLLDVSRFGKLAQAHKIDFVAWWTNATVHRRATAPKALPRTTMSHPDRLTANRQTRRGADCRDCRSCRNFRPATKGGEALNRLAV
jgi:hypothetical protein